MRKEIEQQGKQYSEWTASDFSHYTKNGELYWFYFCSCGIRKPVSVRNVQTGLSTNCGCVRRRGLATMRTTHGLSRSSIYNSWMAMKARCDRVTNADYEHYGGRGITYCPEWATFEGFLKDMQATWAKGLSIERIDTNGNYEPGNCRWATIKEQSRNKRSNVIILCPDGKERVLKVASELYGIPYLTLYGRYCKLKWPHTECFKPVRARAPNKSQGEPK